MLAHLVDQVARLPVWQAFYDHAKRHAESSPKSLQQTSERFSLILDCLQEERCELYSSYGFAPAIFDKLDSLLICLEEKCLPRIVANFESYRRSTEVSTELQLPVESSQSQPGLLCGSPAKAEPSSGNDGENALSPVEKDASDSLSNSNLGRGKRKKFLKLKFDFLDPKGQLTHQAECVETGSDKSLEARVTRNSNSVKSSGITRTTAIKLQAKLQKSSNNSNKFSTEVNTSKPCTKLLRNTSQANKKKVRSVSIKTDNFISNGKIRKETKAVKTNVDRAGQQTADGTTKHADHRNNKRKRNVQSDIEDMDSFKKPKNLKLDDTNGRVVCCLGERIDAKSTDKEKEEIKQQFEKSADQTDSVRSHSFNNAKPKTEIQTQNTNSECPENKKLAEKECSQNVKAKKKKRKEDRVKERPLGERYYLDCDLLAPMVCAVCRATFPTLPELSTHWRQNHKQEGQSHRGKIFMCPKCEKTFATSHAYKLHHRIHVGAKPHACPECERPFRTYRCLVDHLNTHKQELKFPCPTCRKVFGSSRLMKQHMKRHLERPRPFTCEICGKTFPRRPSLVVHLSSVHRKERPHKCSYCGVAFNQRGSLTTHMRLHTGDKHHICDICGGRFNTNVALITHRRKHTGERPYKCDQCDFAASSSSSLKDHMSVHSTEKPYKCAVANCKGSFKRRSHLISHQKTHIGARPYQCQRCGVSFSLTSELNKHQRINSCHPVEEMRIKIEVPAVEMMEALPEESTGGEHQSQGGLENLVHRDLEEDLPITQCGDEGNNDIQDCSSGVVGQGSEGNGESGAETLFCQEDCGGSEEKAATSDFLSDLPANSLVIEIIREPGKEYSDDLVLSKEEMEAIVRISQDLLPKC